MRRIVRSAGYAKTRVGIGAALALLGVVLLYRTITLVGLKLEVLPAFVLGAALIALGYVRWREYRAARSNS